MFDDKKAFQECLDLAVPELHIVGEIDKGMYTWVGQALTYLKTKRSPDINIIFDSGGGDVGTGLDIYDMLRLYSGKKTAIVVNRAGSIAAIIVQACEVRKCSRHAGILIHHISRSDISLNEISTRKGWQKILKKLREIQERLYRILEDRTKRTRREIVKECRQDRYMKSEDALKFCLIDEIV